MSELLQVVASARPAFGIGGRALGWERKVLLQRAGTLVRGIGSHLLPPLVMVGILLAIWQLLAAGATSTLPPPSKVLGDSWELIVDPFYDRGGLDKGMFWHLAASLRRVALGFSLAAVNHAAATSRPAAATAGPFTGQPLISHPS